MKQKIELKNISMSVNDFHRACQTGLAMRIERLMKMEKHDFDNMPIKEVEDFVNKYGYILG